MSEVAATLLFVARLVFFAICASAFCASQELPYLVTYSQDLEEPGNLELAVKSAIGSPASHTQFRSATVEMEYGVTAWWTSEVCLSAQSQSHDSTIFTGFRIENRIRPLFTEHFINPVLYFEYEDINGADRSLFEVVGHDGKSDLLSPNWEARSEVEHALETRLILSSNYRGWNVSENFIAERDFSEGLWEFGYAIGVSRPLAFTANPRDCTLCRKNFSAGAELYGGIGDADSFGLHDTSHYFGPSVSFAVPRGPTLTFSPDFGLNDRSLGTIFRFKLSYEFEQIFRRRGRN